MAVVEVGVRTGAHARGGRWRAERAEVETRYVVSAGVSASDVDSSRRRAKTGAIVRRANWSATAESAVMVETVAHETAEVGNAEKPRCVGVERNEAPRVGRREKEGAEVVELNSENNVRKKK